MKTILFLTILGILAEASAASEVASKGVDICRIFQLSPGYLLNLLTLTLVRVGY